MALDLRRIKNSTLLNGLFVLVFVLAMVPLLLIVNALMRQQALVEAEEKAQLMLERNLAIHSYYAEELKPRLFALTDPFRSPDYFEPSWMSSSYAVRAIQERFEEFVPRGYSMKDAVRNARNPENEADSLEAAFLDDVNADPDLETHSFRQDIDGTPYLVYLHRGEVLDASCLRCHGDPARAPAGLTAIYGAQRGFGRGAELGTVVSAISIRVPLSVALGRVGDLSRRLSLALAGILACFFLLQYWLNRRILYTPIALLRDKALEISTGEARLGEQVPLPFGRELGDLAAAFNRMSVALRFDRDHLEERIKEGVAVLESTNERLEHDIEERKATEEQLKGAMEENVRLLRELQHRAKNSFGMIRGLIGYVAAEGHPPETRQVLEKLDQRVSSVAELYSLLYASSSPGEVWLDEYCRRIVDAMSGLDESVRMRSVLEPVRVSVSLAAPVGLIVTELLTNALKYAFPGGRKGEILLSLAREGATGVRIEVRDDGVGLPPGYQASRGPGTGLALVEGLAGQIGGAVSLEGDASGTRAVLRFES
jgi:two-component sensor histidine kinase